MIHFLFIRIGTLGFLTVEGDPGEMTKVNGTTRGTNSVMMLRPSQTLIYVGGYPTSIQVGYFYLYLARGILSITATIVRNGIGNLCSNPG